MTKNEKDTLIKDPKTGLFFDISVPSSPKRNTADAIARAVKIIKESNEILKRHQSESTYPHDSRAAA